MCMFVFASILVQVFANVCSLLFFSCVCMCVFTSILVHVYTVGVNIKFPYRAVYRPYRTLKKTPSKTVPFYSAGRDTILLLYAIRI